MTPMVDPRRGDVADDASSTKQRSLLSLAGTLAAEISLPKLTFAWLLLIGLPAYLIGAAPLIASIWFSGVSAKAIEEVRGPAGLDIGARTPAEIALSILAEALSVRTGGGGRSLRDRAGPIHIDGLNTPPAR